LNTPVEKSKNLKISIFKRSFKESFMELINLNNKIAKYFVKFTKNIEKIRKTI
jgi:hypothetical protein